MNARRILALALASSLGGCAAEAPDAGGEPAAFVVGDVHPVGTSDAVAEVVDMTVLDDGSVWVLNSLPPFFVGFAADGTSLGAYGTEGGGPDEFSLPAGFVTAGPGADAWVLDARRNTLIQVPRSEAGRVEVTFPRDSLPLGSLQPGLGFISTSVRSARLGEEVVVARSFGSLREGPYALWSAIWGADLLAVSPDGAAARPLLSLAEVLGDPSDGLTQVDGFPPFPMWFRLWAVCPDGSLRVLDRVGNQLRAFGPDGAERGRTALPAPRFGTVTREDFARAVFDLRAAEVAGRVGGRLPPADSARVFDQIVAMMPGSLEEASAFLPRYVDMRCAEDGSVWLQPIDLSVGNLKGGTLWLRVGPDDGVHEVDLPPRFDAYRFHADRIWGVQRDAFDVATVAWIDVENEG